MWTDYLTQGKLAMGEPLHRCLRAATAPNLPERSSAAAWRLLGDLVTTCY